MMSANQRRFFRVAAWIFIGVAVAVGILNGLRQIGLVSPPVIVVNNNALYQALSLFGATVASVVQGGILLVLISIDERIQNRGS